MDISSAFILAYPKGVGPIRVLQGVAAGLVGRESAITGGLATAGLGLAIHFFIAFVVATVFYMASRKFAFLTRHAVISGLVYGVVVYGFMYWIVMPLAYPVVHPSVSRDVTAVCVHMLLIGLPICSHRAPIFQPPRFVRLTMNDPLDFTGKVVLVTGSSRGLGAEMIKAFGKRGAKCVVNYVADPAGQNKSDADSGGSRS